MMAFNIILDLTNKIVDVAVSDWLLWAFYGT